MRVIRVFPRKTRATPDDDLVRVGRTPSFFDEADEIHVSVTWTWDLPYAERLAESWWGVAPVKMGGPATGMAGNDFVPGVYVKNGYVITSRGCPNRCWFCSVWRRDGNIRELPIHDGWNVLDDNLLACGEQHIRNVFGMLKRQPTRAQFTGGLEAARLKDWHIELLADLKPAQAFFAYDTPDDLEPLQVAGIKMKEAGLKIKHPLRAYVLIGQNGDTIPKAEARLYQTIEAGFLPMAMLYRPDNGERDVNWMRFQRKWARPAIMAGKV